MYVCKSLQSFTKESLWMIEVSNLSSLHRGSKRKFYVYVALVIVPHSGEDIFSLRQVICAGCTLETTR